MVRKLKSEWFTIKELYKSGFTPSQIARKKKISRQKVNYWLKKKIKTEIKRRTKLNKREIQKVIELTENRTTSEI